MTFKKYKAFFNMLALLLLLFPASCKKDSKKEVQEELPRTGAGKLSIVNNNIDGYQLVTVSVTDFVLSQPSYDLKVGTKDVKGVNNNDGTLSFIFPGDLPSGTYDVKATFATGELSVTVKAPVAVADPAKALKDISDQLNQEVQQSLLSADTAAASTEKAAINQVKANLDQAMAKFNALPAANKQVVAQFLAANMKGFEQGERDINELTSVKKGLMKYQPFGLQKTNTAVCGWECYFGQLLKVTTFALAISVNASASPVILGSAALVVGLEVGLSIITGKKSILAFQIKKLLEEGITFTYFPQIKYLEAVFQEVNDKLGGVQTNAITAPQLNILIGEPVSFKLRPVYRSMQRTDGAKSAVLAQLITAFDAVKPKFDAIYGSALGALRGFTNNEEKREAKKLDDWQIKVISGNVTVTSPTGTAGDFKVTFNSTATEKQIISFDIIYKGFIEEVKETVSATLIVHRQAFKAVIVDGNNQGGQPGKLLPKKLQVKVIDTKDAGVANVKVSWTTIGGGTITTQSTTNAQGIAEADWTLGATGTQTAQASIKNDLDVEIQGSPVVFSATEASPNSIAIASGNHQDGQLGKKLGAPISVKIVGADGSALSGVKVQWSVYSGSGTLSAAESTTDAQGIAQVEWTLGNTGAQKVQASAKKKDGSLVSNAPITFDAGTGQDQSATYAAAVVGNYVITDAWDISYKTKVAVASNGTTTFRDFKTNAVLSTGKWAIKRSADGYRFVTGDFPQFTDDKAWDLLSVPVYVIIGNVNDLDPITQQPRWRKSQTWTRQ